MIMSLPLLKFIVFFICLCFNMVSFRGQKSLGHAQIGLVYGFYSKFPTSIRTTFICGVPPTPPGASSVTHIMQTSMQLLLSSVFTQYYRTTIRSFTGTYNYHEVKPQPILNAIVTPGIIRFGTRLSLFTETVIVVVSDFSSVLRSFHIVLCAFLLLVGFCYLIINNNNSKLVQ